MLCLLVWGRHVHSWTVVSCLISACTMFGHGSSKLTLIGYKSLFGNRRSYLPSCPTIWEGPSSYLPSCPTIEKVQVAICHIVAKKWLNENKAVMVVLNQIYPLSLQWSSGINLDTEWSEAFGVLHPVTQVIHRMLTHVKEKSWRKLMRSNWFK